jgi:hypothetical protein
LKHAAEHLVYDIPKSVPIFQDQYDKYVVPSIDALTGIEARRQLAGLNAHREHKKDYTKEDAKRDLEILLREEVHPERLKAMDAFFEKRLGMSTQDIGKPGVTTFDSVIEELLPPTVREKVRQAKNPDDSMSMTPEQYLAIWKDVFGSIKEVVTGITVTPGILETEVLQETMETVERIDPQQIDILAWLEKDEQKKAQDREKRRLEAIEHQTILEGANATVYLLSTVVGLAGNKELSNQISTIGGAAIQFYQSYEKFADTMVELGNLSKLAERGVGLAEAMAGAAFAGNILGIAMAIVPLFVETGPTPEEVILQEVGVLREQVNTLHKQMHERFDRIEKMLNEGFNAMYELTQEGFADVNLQLFELRRDVDDIQADLVSQALKLDRMGQGLQAALQDGFRINFWEVVYEALDYKAKNQGEPMTRENYIEFESKIRTWATYSAFGDTEQHVTGRSYADDALLEELEKYPLEENIMYLSNWLQKSVNNDVDKLPVVRHSNEFTKQGSLANPVTWATVAEIYARLRYENPEHSATEVFEGYNGAVEEVGQDLRYALRSIVVKEDTIGGPVPDKELFRKLVANYKQKAKELDEALLAKESDYLTIYAKLPKVDPWGVAQQMIDHTLVLPSNAPSNMASFIPPPYPLADYMKLDASPPLTIEFSPSWTERIIMPKPGTAKLSVAVIVKYKGTPIVIRHVVGDRMVNEVREYVDAVPPYYTWRDKSPHLVLQDHWEQGQNLKGRFEAGASQGRFPPVILSDVVDGVEVKLRELRAAIYQWLRLELGAGQSLNSCARKLDGAKAILDRFINLGMPFAVERDDFLRAMLYGAQSLVDSGQVRERYDSATRLNQVDSFVSLRSFNYPTRFVGHQEGLGELMEVQSALDKQAAEFRIVPGLADSTAISFESVSHPGHYLRHQDYRVKLHPFSDDSLFKADATFWVVTGLAEASGFSFKSYNYPDRYLRHSYFHMMVEAGSGSLFMQDATFDMVIQNPRSFVKQDADARAEALYKPGPDQNTPDQGATGVLADYLDLVGKKDAEGRWLYREFHPLLDSTIIKLQTTSAVAKVLSKAINADTTPPETVLELSGPTGTVITNSARFAFSSSDADVASFECSLDGAPFETCTSPKDYTNLSVVQHTFSVRAVDKAGNIDPTPASRSWTIETADTQAPKVTSTLPASNATGVKRNTNITATFSEKMDPLSITKSTFKLFKVNTDGSTTQITNVSVTPSTDGLKATLNPFGTTTTLLAKSTKYKAVVTTGAKDVAGNPLDQNPTTSGNQQMVWSFKTGLL